MTLTLKLFEEGDMSLRAAINAKCRECIYDSKDQGTWRQQVGACTCPKCPLFPHRPVSIGHTRNRAELDDFEGKPSKKIMVSE